MAFLFASRRIYMHCYERQREEIIMEKLIAKMNEIFQPVRLIQEAHKEEITSKQSPR